MQHLIAMVIYMAAVVGIGIYFSKRANHSAENYFLGGRSLGPWVAAFSAEASDMSGWLLMGLPGLAYWTGLAEAGWTAIGLFIGTYFNWLIVPSGCAVTASGWMPSPSPAFSPAVSTRRTTLSS